VRPWLHSMVDLLIDLLDGRSKRETWRQQIERRLNAVEIHLQNLPPERG